MQGEPSPFRGRTPQDRTRRDRYDRSASVVRAPDPRGGGRRIRRIRHSRQVFGLAGTGRVIDRPTGRRFPGMLPSADDGGRSCSPLRDSPGFSPGSLSPDAEHDPHPGFDAYAGGRGSDSSTARANQLRPQHRPTWGGAGHRPVANRAVTCGCAEVDHAHRERLRAVRCDGLMNATSQVGGCAV